jgi:hypothetical protein
MDRLRGSIAGTIRYKSCFVGNVDFYKVDAISRLKTAVPKKEILGNKAPIGSLVNKSAASRSPDLPKGTPKEIDDFEFMFCFLGRGNDGSFRRTVSHRKAPAPHHQRTL